MRLRGSPGIRVSTFQPRILCTPVFVFASCTSLLTVALFFGQIYNCNHLLANELTGLSWSRGNSADRQCRRSIYETNDHARNEGERRHKCVHRQAGCTSPRLSHKYYGTTEKGGKEGTPTRKMTDGKYFHLQIRLF